MKTHLVANTMEKGYRPRAATCWRDRYTAALLPPLRPPSPPRARAPLRGVGSPAGGDSPRLLGRPEENERPALAEHSPGCTAPSWVPAGLPSQGQGPLRLTSEKEKAVVDNQVDTGLQGAAVTMEPKGRRTPTTAQRRPESRTGRSPHPRARGQARARLRPRGLAADAEPGCPVQAGAVARLSQKSAIGSDSLAVTCPGLHIRAPGQPRSAGGRAARTDPDGGTDRPAQAAPGSSAAPRPGEAAENRPPSPWGTARSDRLCALRGGHWGQT